MKKFCTKAGLFLVAVAIVAIVCLLAYDLNVNMPYREFETINEFIRCVGAAGCILIALPYFSENETEEPKSANEIESKHEDFLP